jgi:outer membrane protein
MSRWSRNTATARPSRPDATPSNEAPTDYAITSCEADRRAAASGPGVAFFEPDGGASAASTDTNEQLELTMLTRINVSFLRATFMVLVALAALLLMCTDLRAQTSATPLTLGTAARMAAERSASTQAARARSSQADARVSQRRADFLPTISTSAQLGTRSFNTASMGIDFPSAPGSPAPYDPDGEVRGPVRSIDMRAQISQRLVDLPAVLRWRAAGSDADAIAYRADAAADNAAGRGATAYLRVLRAEALIAARQADSSLAAELLDIARQQVTAGVGISLDVTRAQSQLADARARLIATRGERDRSMLQLRHELAIADAAPLVMADSLAAPAENEPVAREDEIIRNALQHRADFKAAVTQSEAARTSARAAMAERLPSVSAYADHGSNGKSTDRMLGTYSYGVQVSLPIFDGLRMESRTSEERARQREAEVQAIDMRRQVETDVRSALISVASAREEVAAAQARLVLAEQEVSQARERFRQGVSGNADVITASISLNSARDLVIDALTSYHMARVALASAQGTTTMVQ